MLIAPKWLKIRTSNFVGMFPGRVPTWPLTNLSEKWAWSRSRDLSGLSLGARLPNLKFVSLAILELLAFNAQKITESHDHGHATFRKYLSGVMSGLSLGACLPNSKLVSLAVLELLAFNAPKFIGLHDPGHAPFYPIFTLRGWRPPRHVVWTMNRYNWSIDDVREAFPVSHWKWIVWVPIWAKIW